MTVNIEKQLFYNYFPSQYQLLKIQHDLHNLKHCINIVLRYLNHFAKLLNAAKLVASTISARKKRKKVKTIAKKNQNTNIRKQLLKK